MNELAKELLSLTCVGLSPANKPLDTGTIEHLLSLLPGWEVAGQEIVKTFPFANYYETMAFVNACAWISHRENHHPDLQVSFNRCCVRYTTHDVGGLSLNDFICAAKIENLLHDASAQKDSADR